MQNSNNINQPGFIDNARIGNTDFPQIYRDLLTNLALRQNMPNVNPYGGGAQDSNSIAGMRVTEGPTGFAVPVQYNQMTPIQQGMQYNTASFDNPNLANSGMTPADIDKLRVMQGQGPMSFEMRERLINAMRDRGYQY